MTSLPRDVKHQQSACLQDGGQARYVKELNDYSIFWGQDFGVKASNKFFCSVNLCFVLETGYFVDLKAFGSVKI